MTYDLMKKDWDNTVEFTKKSIADYPRLPLVLPNKILPNNFELQNGKIKSNLPRPFSHGRWYFIYFPKEEVLYGNCILKEKLGNLSYADIKEYPKP